MSNDNIATQEGSGLGISRREMLVGVGVLTAGYAFGQLITATEARGATGYAPLSPTATDVPIHTGLPWPAAWTPGSDALRIAAEDAAIRSSNQFLRGGG